MTFTEQKKQTMIKMTTLKARVIPEMPEELKSMETRVFPAFEKTKIIPFIKMPTLKARVIPECLPMFPTSLTTEPESPVAPFEQDYSVQGFAPACSFGQIKPKTLTKCKNCAWEGSKTTYYSKHKKACALMIKNQKLVEEETNKMIEAEEKKQELKEACSVTMSNI